MYLSQKEGVREEEGRRLQRAAAWIESIYGAAVDSNRWPEVLLETRRRLGVAAVNLMTFAPDTEASPPNLIESGHDPAALAAFSIWSDQDPHSLAGLEHPGTLIWTEALMPAADYERHPFVNEVLHPFDLHYVVGTLGRNPDGSAFGVGMHRPRSNRFSALDRRRVADGMGHLQRAMMVQSKLAAADATERSLAELLDRLKTGAMLVDHNGRILLANHEVRRLACLRDGLGLGGSLLGATPAITRFAQGEIARATVGASAAFSMARPSGEAPFRVLAVSLADGHEKASLGRRKAAVLVLVTECSPGLDVRVDDLRTYLQLTGAEARVAAGVLHGETTREIAARLGISVGTVRVHVREILSKTGTESRTQFVSYVAVALPRLLIKEPQTE